MNVLFSKIFKCFYVFCRYTVYQWFKNTTLLTFYFKFHSLAFVSIKIKKCLIMHYLFTYYSLYKL